MLASFSFRGQKLKVKLTQFLCRPEGGGLVATRMRTQGQDWFQKQRLAILLVGHRNTSALYFENGQFMQGDSPLYGFSQLIDLIVERCTILDKHQLLMALVKAMQTARKDYETKRRNELSSFRTRDIKMEYPNWKQTKAIQGLVSVRNAELRDAEITALVDAIQSALDDYWHKLLTWSQRVLPQDLDELVISGGAARFLQPKFERQFDKSSRTSDFTGNVVWDAELREPMEKAFKRKALQDDLMVPRFADAYGLFDQMLLSAAEKVA